MTTKYAYDGDGQRASATTGTTTTTYTYDVNASLPVVLQETTGTNTRKYVWGQGLPYTVDSSGNLQVYHTDGLGSVRAVTDSSGSVIQTYQTDEFGGPVPSGTQGSLRQPFQYAGEPWDPTECCTDERHCMTRRWSASYRITLQEKSGLQRSGRL